MNQTHDALSNIWNRFQLSLFPWLHEELGELTDKQQQLIRVLEVSQIERHIPSVGQVPGRPLEDRYAIARAFVAKAVYNWPTTERLLDQLTLAERVHTALIETYLGNQLIGHISRDSTAIEAREKPEKKVEETPPPKKRDRPQKGEERIKEPTRLERQSEGMTLTEMKDKLPNHLQCWHETQQQGIQDELDRLQASY